MQSCLNKIFSWFVYDIVMRNTYRNWQKINVYKIVHTTASMIEKTNKFIYLIFWCKRMRSMTHSARVVHCRIYNI